MVPLLLALGAEAWAVRGLQDALPFQHRIECPAMARAERLWLRLGVQAYVGDQDIHALEETVARMRPRRPGLRIPQASNHPTLRRTTS